MSNISISLDNFVLEFAYNFIDNFENEHFVFRISNEVELTKIKKEIKKVKNESFTPERIQKRW